MDLVFFWMRALDYPEGLGSRIRMTLNLQPTSPYLHLNPLGQEAASTYRLLGTVFNETKHPYQKPIIITSVYCIISLCGFLPIST